MAIREYKCPSCGVMIEKILPTETTPRPTEPCPRCGGEANFLTIPTSIGIMTGNFQERKIDIAIGKDAERRWQDVENRQQIRDRVRETSGQSGLSMVGRNEFVPLPEATKVARTEGSEAITSEGFRHRPDTPLDQKLVGTD